MSERVETLRTFVGVPLSGECGRAAAALLRALRGPQGPLQGARVSCPDAGRLHLTLKFLGDTPSDRVPELCEALGTVPLAPFVLALAGAGFFPDSGRPRVFWAGIRSGADELAALARAVDRALAPLGFAPESRPFRPHLTLCRVRDPGRADWNAVRERAAVFVWPEMRVTNFVFWKSVLGPGGPVYGPLGTFGAA